jgi:hypothetical protein
LQRERISGKSASIPPRVGRDRRGGAQGLRVYRDRFYFVRSQLASRAVRLRGWTAGKVGGNTSCARIRRALISIQMTRALGTSDLPVTRQFLRLAIDEGVYTSLEVEMLDVDRARLLESPLFSTPEAFAGDVIEIRHESGGRHRLVRVLETRWRHHRWLVAHGWTDTPHASRYFAAVTAAGGAHEVMAGGLLVVHLPIGSPFDAQSELDRYSSSESADS